MIIVTASASISMQMELIRSCFPLVDGCVSISATGRNPPASFVFKGGLLPMTTLLAIFWWLKGRWFSLVLNRETTGRTVCWFGISSAFFLAIYVVLLGSDTHAYELMRRFGVYLFFLFALLAQGVAIVTQWRCDKPVSSSLRLQLGLCVLMLVLGVVFLVTKPLLDNSRPMENVIEWWFALCLFANIALFAPQWRATSYRCNFSVL